MRIYLLDNASIEMAWFENASKWQRQERRQIQKETSTKMYTPFLIGLN